MLSSLLLLSVTILGIALSTLRLRRPMPTRRQRPRRCAKLLWRHRLNPSRFWFRSSRTKNLRSFSSSGSICILLCAWFGHCLLFSRPKYCTVKYLRSKPRAHKPRKKLQALGIWKGSISSVKHETRSNSANPKVPALSHDKDGLTQTCRFNKASRGSLPESVEMLRIFQP